MTLLADEWQIQVHCFDIFNYNGVNPEFSYHSPKQGYADHLFVLQDNNHFHYISNIHGVLKSLRRTEYADFCDVCFDIKFTHRAHNCKEEDNVDTHRFVLSNRTLANFLDKGEEKVISIGPQFI